MQARLGDALIKEVGDCVRRLAEEGLRISLIRVGEPEARWLAWSFVENARWMDGTLHNIHDVLWSIKSGTFKLYGVRIRYAPGLPHLQIEAERKPLPRH